MGKVAPVRAPGLILLAVVALGAYGLMLDAFAGFQFSTWVTTWGGWAIGLVLVGLIHIVAEGGFEWATGADRTTDPPGKRLARLLLGLAVVVAILALAGFIYSLVI
jgi:amino acid transporter